MDHGPPGCCLFTKDVNILKGPQRSREVQAVESGRRLRRGLLHEGLVDPTGAIAFAGELADLRGLLIANIATVSRRNAFLFTMDAENYHAARTKKRCELLEPGGEGR